MTSDPRKIVERLRWHRECYRGSVDVMLPDTLVDDAIDALANLYAVGLVAEEMGEVLQLLGKGLRFGLDTPGRDGTTARENLPDELGDVEAAIHFACRDGIVPFPETIAARERKKTKLLDPASLDQQGDRLAPEPRGSCNVRAT